MSTRRSRPPRSRKTRASEAPPTDVAVVTAHDPVTTLAAEATLGVDPTVTAQLRALEAGWDELLG